MVALQGMHQHGSNYYTPVPCYVNSLNKVTVNSSGMGTNGVYVPNSTWNFYPVIFKTIITGSINYTACNIGSTVNYDNSLTPTYMPIENRFKYNSNPAYTSIPCYCNFDNTYYSLSVNSSGAITSIVRSDCKYYSVIFNTILTGGINYTVCNMGSYGSVSDNTQGLCGGMYNWSTWNGSWRTRLPCYTSFRAVNVPLNSNGCVNTNDGSGRVQGLLVGGNANNSNVQQNSTAWAAYNWYPAINYKACNTAEPYWKLNKNTFTGGSRHQLNDTNNPLNPVTFYDYHYAIDVSLESNGGVSDYSWYFYPA